MGNKNHLNIFLIAGEASGDLLGGALMAALNKRQDITITYHGIGGDQMQAQGLSSLFPMNDLSVMGIFEVLPRLPLLIGRINQTAAEIKRIKPDVVVTIDAPDFSFRVAKKLKAQKLKAQKLEAKTAEHGIKMVHYVAPTVWAWRAGRAAKIAKLYDHIMCLLPFEPPYFEKEGLSASFVGHPLIDQVTGNGSTFREKHNIAPQTPLLCVLPGSRHGEIKYLLPTYRQSIDLLAQQIPNVQIVIPLAPAVAARVQEETKDWPVSITYVHGTSEKYDAMAASDAALATSGTVALELALSKCPAVIGYAGNFLTAAIVRRMVKVKYANLVNIMLDEPAVPECLQENCTPQKIVSHLLPLLQGGAERQTQLQKIDQVAKWLGQGKLTPGDEAAKTVLSVIGL